MFVQSFRPMATLATVLVLAGVALAPAATNAAESGEVDVTATINSVIPLTITLCDTTADFGTNLDAAGTLSNSTDPVTAVPGDVAQGQGAFYQWAPNCDGGALISVQSGDAWSGTVCGTPGTITSSLTLGDLRFSRDPLAESPFNPYGQISANSVQFPDCSGPADWLAIYFGTNQGGLAGTHSFTFYYYLNIDRSDTTGTFSATTTWAVSG